ncbi:MAG: TetR/AcrR family transcriptional regulator [Acidothermaceae bacterium]
MSARPIERTALGDPPSEIPEQRRKRARMSGPRRREQLLDVGRTLFAERGFDAASVEEVANRAGVSKPVVYTHFGGKEGLYTAVVDREMTRLLQMLGDTLEGGGVHPRELLEQAARAFLDYVEQYTDGFLILARGSGVGSSSGTLTTLLDRVAERVGEILRSGFAARGFDESLAPMYAQMLVGMVAYTGQWWLDVRTPDRDDVVAHVVNLAWNGLSQLDAQPRLGVSISR